MAHKVPSDIEIAQSVKLKPITEIAEKIGIRLNHVSTFLKELKENNLVKCLNEDTRKGRLYELTELGQNAIDKLTNGK